MEELAPALLLAVILGYVAFKNWLHHDRRRMIHRERLVALEKGAELPALEQEVIRKTWNVQRYLLLAGWSFISIGIGTGLALRIVSHTPQVPGIEQVPMGIEFLGLIPIGIGVAHLITYRVGEKRG
jgi:hypothetical protein